MCSAETLESYVSDAETVKTSRLKVLAVMGQHQYGQPHRGEGTEYAAFLPALKRLGHDVAHFESWNAASYSDLAELNSKLAETVIYEQPDVLLFVPFTCEIWLETIQLIGQYGVATVCWTTDDSWKYREQSRFLGPAFHAMTTTYANKLCDYQRDGIANVLLTQWAASSESLNPPKLSVQCKYPVSFVGAAHGDRRATVDYLRKAGLEVHCFGNGWPNGPVKTSQVSEIIRDSVVSLNFANSKGAKQLKARTFEVPGAGGFLLTEEVIGLEDWYVPGAEIAIYRDRPELASKIRYYLQNTEERDEIALAGYHRTLSQHIYEHRMANVLDFALKSQKAGNANRISIEELRTSMRQLIAGHRITAGLRVLRAGVVSGCNLVWGRDRGKRAARRLIHEVAWRFHGPQYYKSTGIPGRMFPHR